MESLLPPFVFINAAQLRAARAMVGWTRVEAAIHLGVGRNTLSRIEAGQSKPEDRTLRDIVAAFSKVGVDFVEVDGAPGVVLREAPRG